MPEGKQIERILMKAHDLGIRYEVIDASHNYMQENPNMDMVTAFELAFRDILSKTKSEK